MADVDGEQALQRYRSLVQAIDDSVLQLDAEGHVRAVNDGLLELTGYVRDDFVGEHVSVVIADEWWRIERQLADRSSSDGHRPDPVALPVRTATGETVPCEFRPVPLADDQQGMIGIVQDVSERDASEDSTDRHELERELEECERRLSSLIDNVPGMVYRCRNERGWPMEFVSDAARR